MRSKTCRGFNACSGIFISGRLWNRLIVFRYFNFQHETLREVVDRCSGENVLSIISRGVKR